MYTYSQDLRERVVRACDEKLGNHEQIAEWFGVSTSWIRRLLQRRRQSGSFAARKRGGPHTPKLDQEHRDRLIVLIREQPDATLQELKDRLGVAVHLSTICRTLARLALTVKKKCCTPASKTVPMSATSGRCGTAGCATSIRTASSFSTR